jgi:hypothetical protein
MILRFLDELIASLIRVLRRLISPLIWIYCFFFVLKSPYVVAVSAAACLFLSLTVAEFLFLLFLALAALLSVDRRIRFHPWLCAPK